jgi:hypothetical protein
MANKKPKTGKAKPGKGAPKKPAPAQVRCCSRRDPTHKHHQLQQQLEGCPAGGMSSRLHMCATSQPAAGRSMGVGHRPEHHTQVTDSLLRSPLAAAAADSNRGKRRAACC